MGSRLADLRAIVALSHKMVAGFKIPSHGSPLVNKRTLLSVLSVTESRYLVINTLNSGRISARECSLFERICPHASTCETAVSMSQTRFHQLGVQCIQIWCSPLGPRMQGEFNETRPKMQGQETCGKLVTKRSHIRPSMCGK